MKTIASFFKKITNTQKMEPLVLKQREPVDDAEVEAWDDDDFEALDDIQFRTASTATSTVSQAPSNHRDSISSRLSMRSDSNNGDENWDVPVHEQASIKDAVALARSKGIPLPANVPRSALEGGTIRRLRGKEIKKAIADDWSEDLDFASAPTQLKLAKPEERDISESLRQISAAFHVSPISPVIAKDISDTFRLAKSRPALAPLSLDQFKDDADDDDFDDVPTIRIAKHRAPGKPTLITSPMQLITSPTVLKGPPMENVEEDFELPADGQLKLSTKKLPPRTPQQLDDFDAEWAEGSLGTRNAGARRGVMSNRSSSIGALSPSVSSAFTAESEDEGLDGLVLPSGPIKFEARLKTKQENQNSELPTEPVISRHMKQATEQADWGEDLEIPDGDVFDSAKLTLNRNIKTRSQRPQSPGKRTTTTLNFTSNKSQTNLSRLPRFSTDRHERVRSNLEPVSETGAPIQRYQRPGSRLGHTANSSVSAIPAPSTPTPSTPSRRGLRNADSRPDMRYEPTTTNAQLLRAKRSMPVIRNAQLNSPTKSTPFQRPPSRQGDNSRLAFSRPKTPIERPESRFGNRSSVPFLTAGASQSQLAGSRATGPRHSRRNDSDGSGESMTAAQRSLSRLAGLRPDTPGKGKPYTAAELAAQAKKTVTKPSRRRNFGDGSELEIFDDLPTSAQAESKFTKQPVGRGAPRSLRSRLGQSHLTASSTSVNSLRAGSETPTPITPLSPYKQDFPTTSLTIPNTNVPRFARDTAASRNMRAERQISTTFQNMRGEPLQPISANLKAQISTRPTGSIRTKKKPIQQKPHLIKPLGADMNRPKEEKGMSYNPVLFRWEGNENALAPFDVPEFNPRGQSPVLQDGKVGANPTDGSPNSKPNLALIMNVGASASGVQVVGGMVFDPRQMKWLKVAEGHQEGFRGGSGSVQLEEEEDVFAGLEDLKEEDTESIAAGRFSERHISRTADDLGDDFENANIDVETGDAGEHSASGDEWGGTVAEEFDVGPEFVRRQRSEEERWRRKVERWLRSEEEVAAEDVEGAGGWRWVIRDMVCGGINDFS